MRELSSAGLRGKPDLLDDSVPVEGVALEFQFEHADGLILFVLILLAGLSLLLERFQLAAVVLTAGTEPLQQLDVEVVVGGALPLEAVQQADC